MVLFTLDRSERQTKRCVCVSYVVVVGKLRYGRRRAASHGETVETQSAQLSTESCLHLSLGK